MAGNLTTACLIYLALALQSSVVPELVESGYRLWLPGIALIGCINLNRGIACILWAGLLGLGVDCLSLDRLGVNMILATALALGLSTIQSENRSPGSIPTGLFVFIATVAWRSSSWFIQGILSNQSIDIREVLNFAIRDGLVSAAISAFGRFAIERLKLIFIRPS